MNYHEMKPFRRVEYAVHESFLGYVLMKHSPIPAKGIIWHYVDKPFGANRISHQAALGAEGNGSEHRYEFFIESDPEGEPIAMICRYAKDGVVDGDSLAYVPFILAQSKIHKARKRAEAMPLIPDDELGMCPCCKKKAH